MHSLKIRFCCLLFLSSVFSSAIGCGQRDTGPETFPVTGVVHINGKPAERVAVLFHHADAAMPSNYRYPTGVTNSEGVFHLSSIGDGDGAVAGKYAVTFTWLSSGELDAFDMLNGAFSNPEDSSFQVEVPLTDPTSLTLELTVPEEQIRKTRPDSRPDAQN
ncbi:MAG: hypothetical protein KDB01_12395 [Planctomycetaceae bacterium]|nr:hypothetical protein [Planctomycetaceae bacterium]